MGQEIAASRFRHQDFHHFERHLAEEMSLLHEAFRQAKFASEPPVGGLELEAWLVGGDMDPQPRNEEFLQRLNSPSVVPELSKFNVEFNVVPRALRGAGLRNLEEELAESWGRGSRAANDLGMSLVSIGILPTLKNGSLNVKTMSSMTRYRALNEQVLRLRRGRPLQLEIRGRNSLRMEQQDVMLEAATTSLQVHLQVPFDRSVRYYNASLIASPIMVAVAANSPLLFGRLLWTETRIPVFEQSVDDGALFQRVSFGSGYAYESLEEVFLENRSCHPVLLPMVLQEPAERFPHVRLHNGTIWRWNRPLLGFDEQGVPHLRVEHRTLPSGPTLVDMAANVAFYYGLVQHLALLSEPPEFRLPFEIALTNFKKGAELGMEAPITWLDRDHHVIRDLVLNTLLDAARRGLEELGVDSDDADRYLDVIARRVESGQSGSVWQRCFVERFGPDMPALTRAYLALQEKGEPVHEWEL